MGARNAQIAPCDGLAASTAKRLAEGFYLLSAFRAPAIAWLSAACTYWREKPVQTTPKEAIDLIFSSHTLPQVLLEIFHYAFKF